MKYGSVCSGIEAASVAWQHLGWTPSFFSEIESFPRDVLTKHYPNTPLHGDFTTIQENDYDDIDLLVGGTPCQSFSIAGLRRGMGDDRGILALEYLRLAQRLRPRWVVWENVTGVLSSGGGRDFGAFLGGLEELGYGWSYRVLDAQYFGVAQRRRRVFVVGHLGGWRAPAEVLLKPSCLSGDTPPGREESEAAPSHPGAGVEGGGVSCVHGTQDPITLEECTFPIGRNNGAETAVVFPKTVGALDTECGFNKQTHQSISADHVFPTHIPTTLGTMTARMFQALGARDIEEGALVTDEFGVRKLSPVECERLQGFPDDYTAVERRGRIPDGPRYKALGNSMAVPVMRWIGEQIQQLENCNEH